MKLLQSRVKVRYSCSGSTIDYPREHELKFQRQELRRYVVLRRMDSEQKSETVTFSCGRCCRSFQTAGCDDCQKRKLRDRSLKNFKDLRFRGHTSMYCSWRHLRLLGRPRIFARSSGRSAFFQLQELSSPDRLMFSSAERAESGLRLNLSALLLSSSSGMLGMMSHSFCKSLALLTSIGSGETVFSHSSMPSLRDKANTGNCLPV